MMPGQRGSILIVVLFLVAVLSLPGLGLLGTTTTDLRISGSYERSLDAFYTTDAGLNDVVSSLMSDPTLGNLAPYPTGTPLLTKNFGAGKYSMWIWNKRVRGNGTTEDFPAPGSRQVIVQGQDITGTSTRRFQGILVPARRAPKALGYPVFSCGNAALNSADIIGTIYSRGDVTWNGVTGKYVNVEATGKYTGTKDLKGYCHTNGKIENNNSKINLACKAGTSIDKPSNCKGGATSSVSPLPVKDYCSLASPDWNPDMLSLTQTEIQDIRDNTLLANRKSPGWTVTGGTLNLNGKYWVSGGNVLWKDVVVNYTGDTVVLMDDGDFTCDKCEIKNGPSGAYLNLITSNGNMTFTGSKKAEFIGVLWAGVWDAFGPPAKGSITVQNDYEFKLKGEVVATVGPITHTGKKFLVYLDTAKPGTFGEANGFAIAEWLEER